MRLAPRLVLAFGFLAAVSTAGLGVVVREQLRRDRTVRFDEEVRSACSRVASEVARQGENDRRLVVSACQSGELVDRTLLALEAGELDARRPALAALVPTERGAFDLDELLLVADDGDVLGADPRGLLATPRSAVEASVRGPESTFSVRPPSPTAPAALVAHCLRKGDRGHSAALVGARRLAPLVERVGHTVGVTASLEGGNTPLGVDVAQATCHLTDPTGAPLTASRTRITVAQVKTALTAELARLDEAVLVAALVAGGVALLLAVVLARSLGRPLSELAAEASKVASGEARPLRVIGSGEVGDLVAAFDKMIGDLEGTRRRLAATSRVAAWREVARRVAHEVKNPLAPIRAAVETLRRLRARNDPAFDEYFDEATRTVLDEVHRISNIVTEFTRFARLPPPRPEAVDLTELVRQVVQLQRPAAGSARLEVHVGRQPPVVRADRDQIIQVLTNVLQNAVEAVAAVPNGTVTATLEGDRDTAWVTIFDNGPGIAPDVAPRLFEPYATTKATGTGLGLAIAQRIALEHGGELTYVGPSPAGGAAFRLVLPVDGPPPISEPPSELTPAP